MTDLFRPEGERGKVRVFRAPGPPAFWKSDLGDVAAIEDALGVDLKPAYVDAFTAADLGSMPLSVYMVEAHSVTLSDEEAALLDAQTGTLVVVPSGAVEGEVEFHEPDGWDFLGLFAEPFETIDFEPLPGDGARRDTSRDEDDDGRPPLSDARIGGMVALAALVVLFLLVGVMIWIAA